MVSLAESASKSSPATLPSSVTIPVNTAPPAVLSWLRWRARRSPAAGWPRNSPAAGALPPIRTFPVGTGITPVQPTDGLGRVADYHRRLGVSPTPEHA